MVNLLERNPSLDVVRAFAIFLVVVGHCLQSTLSNFDQNILFKYIYSFHMPLFIFLSGFLSYQSLFKNSYILDKFKSLIIPYFSWMILTAILTILVHNSNFYYLVIQNLTYPDNGLWYLWVLFWMNIALYLSSLLTKEYPIFLMLLLLGLFFILAQAYKVNNIFGIKTFISLFPYYIIGIFCRKHWNIFIKIFKRWYLFMPFFIMGANYWHRIDLINFYGIVLSPMLTLIYKLIVGQLGICTVFGFFYSIKITSKAILYIGKNTLSIYALNLILISYFNLVFLSNETSVKYIGFVIIFSIGILYASLLINFVLMKNLYLSRFFLGRNVKT